MNSLRELAVLAFDGHDVSLFINRHFYSGGNCYGSFTYFLFEQGYILNYKFIDGEANTQGSIKIALKYDPVDRVNAINNI